MRQIKSINSKNSLLEPLFIQVEEYKIKLCNTEKSNDITGVQKENRLWYYKHEINETLEYIKKITKSMAGENE